MIIYAKLWVLLASRGMKKTDLNKIISKATLAKLGKNASITTDTIDRLCEFLNCQPSDIMEYASDRDLEKLKSQLDDAEKQLADMQKMLEGIAAQNGVLDQYLKAAEAGGSAWDALADKLGLPKADDLK